MTKVSKFFGLGLSQAELDFVDVDVPFDIQLYIDPYAIEISSEPLAVDCNEFLRTFFTEVLESIRDRDDDRAAFLMSNFREPADTFLGVAKQGRAGRGVGQKQAKQLIATMKRSKAGATGLLEHLSDAAMFVEHIGRDKISDLTTNIIRSILVEYTQSQCELHGIEDLVTRPASSPLWNQEKRTWKSGNVLLPLVKDRHVLLVPKHFVRQDISLAAREFYDKNVTEFLQAEHLRANSSLVHVLKSGDPVVTKKSVRDEHKFSKDFIADISKEHPSLLRAYKDAKRAIGPPKTGDIDEGFLETTYATNLINTLNEIPPGREHANSYHRFMKGVMTFLFHPSMTNPQLEKEVNKGRKRIDLLYDNAGDGLFFDRILRWSQTDAINIPVECKNYNKEVGNPEFDQMVGRFSPKRGRFGIIACRNVDKEAALLERQRDIVNDGHGFIIVLADNQIVSMLEAISENKRARVMGILEGQFNKLIT